MASVVQFGRRRGSSNRASSAEEVGRMNQPPDLRKVTVLTKAEWLRIQDEMNQVNKEKESIREAVKQREALHLQSKEVVKQWSNTIAGQRQKTLQAKKIREEIEEEKRKQTDREEAEYQEQKKKEAIDVAKTQLYYQTDRVKGLHRALLLTEVLKEREAQIELKQRIKSSSKEADQDFVDMAKVKDEEAAKQEKEKALEKKREWRAVAEDLKQQIKENEHVRQRHKMEDKEEGEETRRLVELYQWERRMEEERQAKQKRELMHSHLEHLTNRDLIRAADEQKQQAEEEQRKLFLSAKQKMTKLRKDREKELFREAQMRRESIMNDLTVKQREEAANEEQRIAKAVAEQDATRAQMWREKEEKRATMLREIAAHRELLKREKEQSDKKAKQSTHEALEAKREADRIFSEKQQQKAQRMKEEGRKLQDFHVTQMAEKSARQQQLRRDELEFEDRNAELVAEDEVNFQRYSRQVIDAAAEARRNVFPLCMAAREGIGGGTGPVYGGVRPSYLVHDRTGAQMPKYVSGVTQSVKKLNEVEDIQEAKRRLGFTW